MHIIHEFMTGREHEALKKVEGREYRLFGAIGAGFALGVIVLALLVI